MTGSLNDRADSDSLSAGVRISRPVVFTAGIVLLGVSVLPYGRVYELAPAYSSTYPWTGPGVPIGWLVYAWFVIRVAGGRPVARTVVTVLAVLQGVLAAGLALGSEGPEAHVVALVTSAAGVALLYLPQSRSYVAMREADRSASKTVEGQVRRLFEQRGKNGERVYTISDIATRLGLSRTTVYRHLDTDQQEQLRQSPDER